MDRSTLISHHIYCPKYIDIKDINLHLYMGYFILVKDKYYGLTLFKYDPSCSNTFSYTIKALNDEEVSKIPEDARYVHSKIYQDCLAERIKGFHYV